MSKDKCTSKCQNSTRKKNNSVYAIPCLYIFFIISFLFFISICSAIWLTLSGFGDIIPSKDEMILFYSDLSVFYFIQ